MIWLFVFLSIIGAVLNATKRISGYYCWLVSNTFFTFCNLIHKDYAYSLLFLIYTIITILGIIYWSENEQDRKVDIKNKVE